MTLDEMEMQPQEKPGTLTVTHLAIIQDEESGEISRIPLRMVRNVQPHLDPDFHLGAVSD